MVTSAVTAQLYLYVPILYVPTASVNSRNVTLWLKRIQGSLPVRMSILLLACLYFLSPWLANTWYPWLVQLLCWTQCTASSCKMQGEGGKEQGGQVSGHSFLHKPLQKWGREESSLSLLSWHLQVPVLISGLKLTGWVCASAMADGSWLWPSHTYLLCPFSCMRFLQKGVSSVSSRFSQLWAQIFWTWKVICNALCQSLCHSWCSSSPCVHQTMIPRDFLNTLSGSQAGS